MQLLCGLDYQAAPEKKARPIGMIRTQLRFRLSHTPGGFWEAWEAPPGHVSRRASPIVYLGRGHGDVLGNLQHSPRTQHGRQPHIRRRNARGTRSTWCFDSETLVCPVSKQSAVRSLAYSRSRLMVDLRSLNLLKALGRMSRQGEGKYSRVVCIHRNWI